MSKPSTAVRARYEARNYKQIKLSHNSPDQRRHSKSKRRSGALAPLLYCSRIKIPLPPDHQA